MRILIILALTAPIFAQPVTGLSAHYIDIGSGGQSLAVAADSSGGHYIVSTVIEDSGRRQIRVTKTDVQGDEAGHFDFGGSGPDTPAGIAVDSGGAIIVAGTTGSSDFPGVSAVVPSLSAAAAFVVEIDGSLTHLLSSKVIGGKQYRAQNHRGTMVHAIVLDPSGIVIAGSTDATDFPVTQSSYQTTPPGGDSFGTASYGFITKLSPDLKQILFSTYFGADQSDCQGGSACIGVFGQTVIASLALDSAGEIVLGGVTTSPKLPVTSGAYSEQCNCSDGIAFISKFSKDGSTLVWSTFLPLQPGVSNPLGPGIGIHTIAVDSGGNVIVGGSTPTGLAVTNGAVQTSFPGPTPGSSFAGFVTELDSSGSRLVFSTYFGGSSSSDGGVHSLALGAGDSIWATGISLAGTLPGAANPSIGPSYVANLSPDGSSVSNIVTAPNGAAGESILASPAGEIAVLGAGGSLLLSIPPGSPSVLGAANSAGDSVNATIAPAEIVSFYGYNLGPASPLQAQVANGSVATSLSGFSVLFNGVAAPLLYVGSNQINCIVPTEVAGQDTAAVQIVTPQGTFSGPSLFTAPSQPEIFHDADGFAVAINQDGSVNSASNPVGAGSIVSIWASGPGLHYGPSEDGAIVSAEDVRFPALPVSILSGPGTGGATDSLEVLYAGDSPGEVFGLTQVNFRLPQSIASGVKDIGIQLQVGAAVSRAVSVYVRP